MKYFARRKTLSISGTVLPVSQFEMVRFDTKFYLLILPDVHFKVCRFQFDSLTDFHLFTFNS